VKFAWSEARRPGGAPVLLTFEVRPVQVRPVRRRDASPPRIVTRWSAHCGCKGASVSQRHVVEYAGRDLEQVVDRQSILLTLTTQTLEQLAVSCIDRPSCSALAPNPLCFDAASARGNHAEEASGSYSTDTTRPSRVRWDAICRPSGFSDYPIGRADPTVALATSAILPYVG